MLGEDGFEPIVSTQQWSFEFTKVLKEEASIYAEAEFRVELHNKENQLHVSLI